MELVANKTAEHFKNITPLDNPFFVVVNAVRLVHDIVPPTKSPDNNYYTPTTFYTMVTTRRAGILNAASERALVIIQSYGTTETSATVLVGDGTTA